MLLKGFGLSQLSLNGCFWGVEEAGDLGFNGCSSCGFQASV